MNKTIKITQYVDRIGIFEFEDNQISIEFHKKSNSAEAIPRVKFDILDQLISTRDAINEFVEAVKGEINEKM